MNACWRQVASIAHQLPLRLEAKNRASFFVTPSAIDKLRDLKEKKGSGLRICVEVGGCHGFQYVFSQEKPPTPSPACTAPRSQQTPQQPDHIFEVGGSSITIDETSLGLIDESTLDYTRELIGSKFVINNNPKAMDACGCGVSFDLRRPSDCK